MAEAYVTDVSCDKVEAYGQRHQLQQDEVRGDPHAHLRG